MGFPFGILWAAEQCGLLSGKVRTSGTEVNISCPLCGDKLRHQCSEGYLELSSVWNGWRSYRSLCPLPS